MTISTEAQELIALIESISDQLCLTLDDNFDLHIKTDSSNVQGQKLSVLINFLLENVRRNINNLNQLTAQLEDKVEERTNRLNLVIEGAEDTVWFWNVQNDSFEFSEHWSSLTGNDIFNQSFSLNTWLELVHPRDRQKLNTALAHIKQGKEKSIRVEYRILSAKGCYHWILCRGACQTDEKGMPFLVAGTQTDVNQMRSIDQWSGLNNEESLSEYLTDKVANRDNIAVCLLGFKHIDRWLNTIDNQTTQTIRQKISNFIFDKYGQEGFVARLHGDIYAIIIDATIYTDIEAECSKNISAFKSIINDFIQQKDQIGVVAGAIKTTEHSFSTAEDLMRNAWASYREARRNDSNICIYDDSFKSLQSRKTKIETALRQSIGSNGVKPFLQPIIYSKTKALAGFEALARFEHESVGFVPPSDFIPIAEEAGLMPALGESILEQSVAIAKNWIKNKQFTSPFYIAVNISALQFSANTLPQTISKLLEKYALPAEYLRIEVTESAFIQNIDLATQQLAEIRSMGVKIALDDFGTGYSSLSYLRRLPLDTLKIDRSFVSGLHKRQNKHAIVKTVFGLARLLELEVVAEGVELKEELESLEHIGQMKVQGFYFSKPLPSEDVVMYLNNFN